MSGPTSCEYKRLFRVTFFFLLLSLTVGASRLIETDGLASSVIWLGFSDFFFIVTPQMFRFSRDMLRTCRHSHFGNVLNIV